MSLAVSPELSAKHIAPPMIAQMPVCGLSCDRCPASRPYERTTMRGIKGLMRVVTS
jgi:hypothetical protein